MRRAEAAAPWGSHSLAKRERRAGSYVDHPCLGRAAMKARRKKSESGVILIAVLGGILLLMMIVFALSSSVRAGAEELQNRKERLQAYYLARGAVFTSSWLLTQMSTAPDSVVYPGQQFIEWELANGKV